MNYQFESKIEDIIKDIKQNAEKMKKAKLANDKIEFEDALKEHERLHKEYAQILYKQREPTHVFLKRM